MSAGPSGKCKKKSTKKSPQNLKYINERRHEKSHIRKIIQHLARYAGNDRCAIKMLRDHASRAGSDMVRKVETFLEMRAA